MATLELAAIARLVGEQARAATLTALLDGRALTALELACEASVTPQTASSHLDKLTGAGLLAVRKQGRSRYYRLASPLVGHALEAVMVLTDGCAPSSRTTPKIDSALRRARTCYDHLAGQLGVALVDAMVRARYLVLDHDAGEVTPEGVAFFSGLGVNLALPSKSRHVFCRPCLDWSERRPHLAGFVGAALASYCFDRGLLKPQRHGRALTITDLGAAEFRKSFGIDFRE